MPRKKVDKIERRDTLIQSKLMTDATPDIKQDDVKLI